MNNIYSIGIYMFSSVILMVIGMAILYTKVKKTIIGPPTITGLIILIIVLCINLLVAFRWDKESCFIFLLLFPYIGPFVLNPLIHISTALPTYKIGAKNSLIIIVALSAIGLPTIYYSISEKLVGSTMFLMMIYYLIPIILNIISYTKLLKWGEKKSVDIHGRININEEADRFSFQY